MTTHPRIAIIGAGPGGLTLARLLQCNSIPVTIFERESSSTARSQGGILDLHVDSGQRAIKSAGLFSKWQELVRDEGQDFKLLNHTGQVLVDQLGGLGAKEYRPEIDRVVLRQLLLDSVEPGTVHWGHNLARIDARDDGVYDLFFENGSNAAGFDLVVGADGAWSRVRPLVSSVAPFYSGISGLDIRLSSVDKANPKIAQFVGKGSMFAFGDYKSLLAQRNGDESIRVYIMMKTPESWIKTCGIDFTNASTTRQVMLTDYYSNWGEELKDLLKFCDDDMIPRALYMHPVGHTWTSRPGVTLLGDAAHLMTPFAGEGVNMAMLDALQLSNAIVSKKDSWLAQGETTGSGSGLGFSKKDELAAAIRSYEEEMFVYSKEMAAVTERNLKLAFTDDSPKGYLEMLKSDMQIGC